MSSTIRNFQKLVTSPRGQLVTDSTWTLPRAYRVLLKQTDPEFHAQQAVSGTGVNKTHVLVNKLATHPCHPSGHCWNYHPDTLSVSQVTATHLKIGHP